ncbi:MAG: hypothetical protein IPL26_18590 [Leptospiraceae bacterium]|nr:hypothetical protein [Leptospiraceae bacterium]
MELFSKDDSFKEYKNFKDAREDFKDANSEMTDTIDLKTSDAKNINYAESTFRMIELEMDQEIGSNLIKIRYVN